MKKALLALLVVLVLLVVGDRVAESVAEKAIAGQIDDELTGPPTVEISGFPFLTQALAGSYGKITVGDAGVRRAGVNVADFTAVLEDAKVPLGDVLGGKVDAVPVSRVRGTALIAFADLAGEAGRSLRIDAAGEQVRVRGSVTVLGQRIEAAALSDVTLDGDALVVRATGFQVEGAAVSGPVADAIGDLLDLRINLTGLPYDLQVTGLQVSDAGIRVTATARDVVLSR